jgi:predicted nucleotidyltransferase
MTALEILRAGGDFSGYAKLKDFPRSSSSQQSMARALANEAARVLKEEFGATRVVLYGSLARLDYFDEASDIDLMAWGIQSDFFFEALLRLEKIESEWEFSLNGGDSLSSRMLETIAREGVEL